MPCFAATAAGPFGVGDVPTLLHRTFHEEPDLSAVAAPYRATSSPPVSARTPPSGRRPPGCRPRSAGRRTGLGRLPAPLADVVLRRAAVRPPAPPPPYASWGRRPAAALLLVLPVLCVVLERPGRGPAMGG
ncbi:hypothetical protein [Actinoallomurus iriomotensis]|uniref:Uncharacterized protein n=1 Tax=Actinoallomurus iriomotensis TaxID=478107 RepID=A0A9W6RIB8_9ACTN|nr:hypothetical protein [Actinoallomurus iriomotensis]GLY74577.1 hypothetical protein Airi01_028440 [Actinoallomurus iriomotensis]